MATKEIHYYADGEDPELERVEEVDVDDDLSLGQVVTIAPETVDGVRAALAKATTVKGIKDALGPLLDALG